MHWISIDILVYILGNSAPIIALILACFKAEKPWLWRLAWTGIAFLAFTILWNVPLRRSSQMTATAIEEKTYKELSQHTLRFLSHISQMILYASDGWLPNNQSEFFSRRSVDLICRELNAYALPIVEPRTSWSQLFAEETQRYKEFLTKIREREESRMEFNLLKAIESVEESPLLIHPRLRDGFRREKPELSKFVGNFLCIDPYTIAEGFSNLSMLFNNMNDGERRLNLKQTKIPLPTYSFAGLGEHRIRPNIPNSTNRVSFYNYAHGWILSGNEFVSENINAIIAKPISNNYCKNVRVGIVNGFMTGVILGHLNQCNNVKLSFFFVEPVAQVTISYRELYSAYNLVGYGDTGAIIERSKAYINSCNFLNTSSCNYQDKELSIVSMSANIRWVEFGNEVTSTLINGIYVRK